MTSGDEQSGGRDRRKFYRVKVRLPIRHRPLAQGEFEALRDEIESSADTGGLEPAIAARFDRIEERLDAIMTQLLGERSDLLDATVQEDVWISGAGLSLRT